MLVKTEWVLLYIFFPYVVSLGYNYELHIKYQATCYIMILIYMYLYLNVACIINHFLCLRSDYMRQQPLDFLPNGLLKVQYKVAYYK